MTFSTPHLLSVWLSHDWCHHNVSQCYALEKVFLFGQVLEDDHGSPDNGKPHIDETPENPLASHHMFYAVAKHFVILIRNRTNEGLNTISFHGLMADTSQCFHQLCLRLPWIGYTLWSCLAVELGSSFSVSGNNNWQDTGDWYQHQIRQQCQHCYHSICRQYCLCHQFDNRMWLFLSFFLSLFIYIYI